MVEQWIFDIAFLPCQKAVSKHPLPLILRSESYLPLFNEYFMRLLESKVITFMEPSWISQHKGPGRLALLSPLWKSLKQQVRELRNCIQIPTQNGF